MNIEQLEIEFIRAYDEGKEVFIELEMEGFEGHEIIINPHENIFPKLQYYMKTYDENLNHKYAQGIKIVNFGYVESEVV